MWAGTPGGAGKTWGCQRGNGCLGRGGRGCSGVRGHRVDVPEPLARAQVRRVSGAGASRRLCVPSVVPPLAPSPRARSCVPAGDRGGDGDTHQQQRSHLGVQRWETVGASLCPLTPRCAQPCAKPRLQPRRVRLSSPPRVRASPRAVAVIPPGFPVPLPAFPSHAAPFPLRRCPHHPRAGTGSWPCRGDSGLVPRCRSRLLAPKRLRGAVRTPTLRCGS